MTTEWKDITDPEELFRLKREGWEIEWSTFAWRYAAVQVAAMIGGMK